jgi:hypothetical protein
LLGCIDGIFDRSLYKVGRGGLYGAGYGLAGGIGGLLLGELVLWLLEGGMVGRASGWLFFGLAVGSSEGLANRAPKKISYGALGGTIGGALGGALFEWLRGAFGSYMLSQALGLLILGACIGSLIGVVEDILRAAWLMVLTGRQEGKEFTLAKAVVTIGSSERCDVALFYDEGVAARHAQISCRRGAFVLSGLPGSEGNIAVNSHVITGPYVLQNQDHITLGQTPLLFQCRQKADVIRR